MANISEIVRISPCCKLLSGKQSKECRPTDDIIDPVAVQSVQRAIEIGEQELYRTGNRWINRQTSTTITKNYKWGDTFVLDTPNNTRKIGIVGPVQQNFSDKKQQLIIKYIQN